MKKYDREVKISKTNWTFGIWFWKRKAFGIEIGPLEILWKRIYWCLGVGCERRCADTHSFCCYHCRPVKTDIEAVHHTTLCNKRNNLFTKNEAYHRIWKY